MKDVGSKSDSDDEEIIGQANPEESKTAGAPSRDNKDFEEFMKKYGFKSQAQALAKCVEIKNERKELRIKLDAFQKNFETQHNRKIRYTKDIVAVKNEFKRYKDLKAEIALIESMLKLLPK